MSREIHIEGIDEVKCAVCGRAANLDALQDEDFRIWNFIYCPYCDLELDEDGNPVKEDYETYDDIYGEE